VVGCPKILWPWSYFERFTLC